MCSLFTSKSFGREVSASNLRELLLSIEKSLSVKMGIDAPTPCHTSGHLDWVAESFGKQNLTNKVHEWPNTTIPFRC